MRNIHISEKSRDVYHRDDSFVICPMRSTVTDFVLCNAGCAWFLVDAPMSYEGTIHKAVFCGGKAIGNIVEEP